LIGSGSYFEGSIQASYYITFSTNLEIISDWEDSTHSPSSTSNLLLVTKDIAASTTIINNNSFLKYINVNPNLNELDTFLFLANNFNTFWSIFPIRNDTILALGSAQLSSQQNPLLESTFKVNPMCNPTNWIFNPSKYKCYSPCPFLSEKGSSTCIEYDKDICIKCEITQGYSCSNDNFNQNSDICCLNSTMKIIDDSIKYNEKEQMIKAKFNFELKYFSFPIKLYLIDSSGSISNNIKYSKYEISNNTISIFGISNSQIISSGYIKVNLSNLKIQNNCGYESPILDFFVNIHSNENLNNSFSLLSNNIASFMNNNKYYKIGISFQVP